VNLAELPQAFQIGWAALVGAFVGSFLNVCIHRWPLEDQTISKPRRSRCPSCGVQLSWKDNVPVLSWTLLRGRCRSCGWRIPWRYPLVELLAAALFGFATLRTGFAQWELLLVQVVVLSGLVVATFVDFALFEIPDEVSIGGIVLAPLAAFLVPKLHADTWIAQSLSEGETVDRFGALCGAGAGMLVGGGILWIVGWLGSRAFGREAMGFGDVKLLAAGGGFVGPGGVLAAIVLASFVASIVGVANVARFHCLLSRRHRQRGRRKSFGQRLALARIAGRYLPFGPYLALGVGIALLCWNDIEGLIELTR